jgi:hypothetical protein
MVAEGNSSGGRVQWRSCNRPDTKHSERSWEEKLGEMAALLVLLPLEGSWGPMSLSCILASLTIAEYFRGWIPPSGKHVCSSVDFILEYRHRK